jgi:hypothetical protein
MTNVGVYWGARKWIFDECAERLKAHFAVLSACSPNLAAWFEKGRQGPKTNVTIDVASTASLRGLLEKGRNRADQTGDALPELGFIVDVWNGRAGGWGASSMTLCGLYSKTPGLSNSAVVSIDFDKGPPMLPEELVGLLKSLVTVWDAEEGRVSKFVNDGADELTYATYLAAGRRAIAPPGKEEPFKSGRLWVDEKRYEDFAPRRAG